MATELTEIRLPSALEAERALLGSVILENALLETARGFIVTSDFYLESHKRIYRAMLNIVDDQGSEINPVTLAHRLRQDEDLDLVGGNAYIASLYTDIPRFSHIESVMSYIQLIKETALQRRIITVGNQLITRAADREPALEIIRDAERELDEWQQATALRQENTIYSDTVAAFQRLRQIEASGVRPGFRTGFSDLDRIVHGYQRGLLYLLAADSGEGKSTVALQTILRINLSHLDQPENAPVIGLISLEMPREKVMDRLLQLHSGVPEEPMMSGAMDEAQWREVSRAAQQISHFQRTRIAEPKNKIEIVRQTVLELERAYGHIDLLIIDYLQLLTSDDQNYQRKNRADQLEDIAYELKSIALRHNCIVLSLSQLNRGGAKKDQRELDALRGSGGIVQAADAVMMLTPIDREAHRNGYPRVDFNFEVIKNRYGRKGRFALQFDSTIGSFGDCNQ